MLDKIQDSVTDMNRNNAQITSYHGCVCVSSASRAKSSNSLDTECKIQENGPFQNELSYDSSESVQKLDSRFSD